MSLSQNWKVRGRPVKESEMEEFESGWNKTGKWNRGTIRWNVSHFLFVQQILGLISFSNFFAKSYKMQSMVFAVHGNRFFLWLVEEGGILKKNMQTMHLHTNYCPLSPPPSDGQKVNNGDNSRCWIHVEYHIVIKSLHESPMKNVLPKSLFLNFKILTTFDVNCRWRSYIQWTISNAGNYHLPCTSLFYIPLWMLKYDESLVGQLTRPFTRSTPSTITILGKRLFVEKKKLSKCWNNRIRCFFMLDWAIQIWITAKSKAIKHTKSARSLKRIQRTFNFDK